MIKSENPPKCNHEMKQVAQRSFKLLVEKRKEGWLHVGVHVGHLAWTSTAAVVSLRTQRHANPPLIQPSLRALVQGLIAMLLMMAQALLHARLMNMPLFSALALMGTVSPLNSVKFNC